MRADHWQLLLAKDEQGAVTAILLEESRDGLDLAEITRSTFGPFDTCKDVTDWLCRHWSPRAGLALR